MQFFHFNICKKNIALKISYKIVALFTENYPSLAQEFKPCYF